MIPQCFPSSNGKMQVNLLASTTGKTEWIDYIPVQNSFGDESYTLNSYANNGAIEVNVVDPTGLVAGIDYINVYEDAAKTVPWSDDTNGYIPVYFEAS